MAGGPPWATRGTKGSGETVAVNERPVLVDKNFDQTTNLANGNSEVTEIYAPTDAVWTVVAPRLVAKNDADWTSGSHRFVLTPAGSIAGGADARSDYQTNVNINFGVITKANNLQSPQTEVAQNRMLQSLQATESQSIDIKYQNNADATQENPRRLDIVFTEVTY